MANDMLGLIGVVSVGVGVMVAFVSQVAPIGTLARKVGLFIGGALFGAGFLATHFAGMM